MLRILSSLLFVMACCLTALADDGAAIQPVDRILLLGDSNTYAGGVCDSTGDMAHDPSAAGRLDDRQSRPAE